MYDVTFASDTSGTNALTLKSNYNAPATYYQLLSTSSFPHGALLYNDNDEQVSYEYNIDACGGNVTVTIGGVSYYYWKQA